MPITITTSNILLKLDQTPIKETEGSEVDMSVGKAFSSVLAYVKSSDPLRSFLLAEKFYKDQTVEITSDDCVFIKNLVKESNYAPLIQGQLIRLLE